MNLERKKDFQFFEGVLYRWTAFAVLFSAMLKFRLIFSLNIHWDEFLFLSRVYEFLRGDQINVFQSFHVHFFQWLTFFHNEIDQIIIARGVMFVIGLFSAGFIFKISRLYTEKTASLFSVLCYFSYSNIMGYGNHFRADPIAVFLFLAALYFILRNRLRRDVVVSGVLLALGLMVTVKASVYVAAVFCVYMIQGVTLREKKKTGAKAFIFFCSLTAFFLLLYVFHKFTLRVEGLDIAGPRKGQFLYFRGLFHKMFLAEGFFPRAKYFLVTFKSNVVIWGALIAGAAAVFWDGLKQKDGWQRQVPLLGLMILPLTVCVYRNAWSYYYVFIIPPVIVFCGIAVQKFLKISQEFQLKAAKVFLCVLVFAVTASGIESYFLLQENGTKEQRRIVSLVHTIFPEPVAYIDRCSMISSYSQAGFFMSTWGMEDYRDRGEPVFEKFIATKHPYFLIANKKQLDPERIISPADQRKELLKQDRMILRQNYVRHWGPLFVAGKSINFFAGDSPGREFQIFIPEVYTLESKEGVVIDKKKFLPGESFYFDEGRHIIEVDRVPADIILRIGKNLYKPKMDWSGRPLFNKF